MLTRPHLHKRSALCVHTQRACSKQAQRPQTLSSFVRAHPRSSLARVALLSLSLSLPLSLSAAPQPVTKDQANTSVKAMVEGESVDLNAFNATYTLRRGHYKTPELSKAKRDRVLFLASKPLIEAMLLKRALKERGLHVDEAKVKARVEAIRSGLKTEERFTRYLEKISQTPHSFERQQWVKEAAFAVLSHDKLITPTEADLQQKRAQVADRLSVPERVRARQLSVPLPRDPKPEQVRKAFKKIQAAHEVFLKGDVSFELLIQRYSEGPLRGRRGDIGYVSKGDLEPPVEKALWALKEGEVSVPVRSMFGWHLIQRQDTLPAYTRTLEELLPNVRDRVTQLKFHQKLGPFLKSLWRRYKVETSFELPPAYRAPKK